MTDVRTFPARTQAVRYARALGRIAHHRRDGRPPLPRCDSPRWGDSAVRQGPSRVPYPECPCESRTDPDESCPYVTWAHARVLELPDGTFAVPVDATARAAEREGAVDVDGVPVPLAGGTLRALTEAERDDERVRVGWTGRELARRRGVAIRGGER